MFLEIIKMFRFFKNICYFIIKKMKNLSQLLIKYIYIIKTFILKVNFLFSIFRSKINIVYLYYFIFVCFIYIFYLYFILDILLSYIFENLANFIDQYNFNLKIEETKKFKKRYSDLLFLLNDKMIDPYQIIGLSRPEGLSLYNTIINYYDLDETDTEEDVLFFYSGMFHKRESWLNNLFAFSSYIAEVCFHIYLFTKLSN